MYTEYINILVFDWRAPLTTYNDLIAQTIRIPKILNVGDKKDVFSIIHPLEYHGIFPKNSILILSKSTDLKIHDVLLVRNKILNNLIFIRHNEKSFNSVLTHEIVDIEQYTLEGVIVNIILDNVFLNLYK